MKLVEIQVDRCGVWRDLTLPLVPDGINVVYGPNEAGKSTLVRFIGGVLFGFGSVGGDRTGDAPAFPSVSGSLVVEEQSVRRRIRRSAIGLTSGAACLVDSGAAEPADEFLAEALRGLDERAYQAAFTVDLPRLQELSDFPAENAFGRIYDVAVGPEGKRLLSAARRAEQRRIRLVDSLQQDGELVRLFERHDQLAAELRQHERAGEQHAQRRRECDRLEGEIADLRERQSGIREQLRGHRFLERAAVPWQQARDCRCELDKLPAIADFPERGLERLEQIETQIAAAAETRDHLLSEAKQLRRQLKTIAAGSPRPALVGTMQGFVDQSAWLAELAEQHASAARRFESADRARQAALEGLGPEWDVERLAEFDPSPAAWQRISGTAQSLQRALQRRQTLQRHRRRLASRSRELRDSLAECLHDLKGESIETALAAARERLRQVNHLARMQLREAELNQRQVSLLEHRDRIAPQLTLPRWVYIVLGVFSFMGIVLAGWGLIAGVATSGIAGAIYAMLGITCGGLAVGLKTQYEGDARRKIAEADAQLAAALAELAEARTSIARISAGPISAGPISAGPIAAGERGTSPAQPDAGELVRIATERVAELVELAQHQRNWRSIRRRLDETRQKHEIARREVETVRESWGRLLAEQGFPQSQPAGAVLEAWQQLIDARTAVDRCEQARASYRTLDEVWTAFRKRIAEFGRRLGDRECDYDRPLEVLESWERRLSEFGRWRDERRERKGQLRGQRRAAAAERDRVGALKVQRDALFVQGGSASRDEFELRARQAARRNRLEEQLAQAELDLETIGSEHTDLALVEDDLFRYAESENASCIETLTLESADLDRDLQRALEAIASAEREAQALESDRSATRLRFEIEQVREKLREASREWAVVELAAQAGDDLRRDYERDHQSAALVEASRYLSRLSSGRYPSIWSPLGERRLKVGDDRGQSLAAASLSRGTREQLFLAVRLAVAQELARNGTVLPMIFDDVFVNFDEERAEAAADVLCEYARNGHQVLLFTCHLHLARLFQARGIEPIWLPDRRGERDGREEQRRAG